MGPKLPYDIKSSIVVSLIALPLCLGIALASGAPLSSGILSGIIGGIVVGFFSNSHISVSGPAAGLTVIVLGLIERFGLTQFYSMVVVAGLIQILFSLLRGGRIGDLFPSSVIHGMLAAIGLILIIKQLPSALGTNFSDFQLSYQHLLISGLSLVTIIFWDKFNYKFKYLSSIPSALMAVVLSTAISSYFNLFEPSDLVRIPDDFFSSLSLHIPNTLNSDIFLGAITIAIIASIESLLCIDAGDKIDRLKRSTSKNRELLAQGLANTLSGVVGAIPVTAVIVRTTVNITAGAKTKWSAIFHGLWLILFVSVGSSFLNKVPLATLSIILLLVGYKLTRPNVFKRIYEKGLDQFLIFITTVTAIMMTDLLKGVIIGLVFALILESRFLKNKVFTRKNSNQHILTFAKKTSYLAKLKIESLFAQLNEDEELIIECGENMNTDVEDYIKSLSEKFPTKVKKLKLKTS